MDLYYNVAVKLKTAFELQCIVHTGDKYLPVQNFLSPNPDTPLL